MNRFSIVARRSGRQQDRVLAGLFQIIDAQPQYQYGRLDDSRQPPLHRLLTCLAGRHQHNRSWRFNRAAVPRLGLASSYSSVSFQRAPFCLKLILSSFLNFQGNFAKSVAIGRSFLAVNGGTRRDNGGILRRYGNSRWSESCLTKLFDS